MAGGSPHTGRGGWTWYTGSADWMYRLIVESLLGLQLEVERLHIAPCLPAYLDVLTIHYRYRENVYHIDIAQIRAGDDGKLGVTGLTVDGVEQDGHSIPLADDHREHSVQVRVPAQ